MMSMSGRSASTLANGSAPICATISTASSIVDGCEIARRPAFGDAALAQAGVDHRPVDAGIDRRQLELVAVGRRQLADQVDHEVDLRVGAGAAGRADDQRDLALVRRLQHQRHVARIGLARHERLAQPQHVRAGIGRARVDDHGVDAAVDAAPEMLGGHAVAQHALRREDAKFFGHARLRSMVCAPACVAGRGRPSVSRRVVPGYSRPEQAAPLQLGHDQPREVLVGARNARRRQHEAVARRLEPFLHLVGDLARRAAEHRPVVELAAARGLDEVAHRRVLLAGLGDHLVAQALPATARPAPRR